MATLIDTKEFNQLTKSPPSEKALLPLPSIDGIDNGVIDWETLQRGLTLRIPPFDGMKAGDPFRVVLAASAYGVFFSQPGTIEDATKGATVWLPPDEAIKFKETHAELQYFYPNHPEQISPTSRYIVAVSIFRPVVDEAVNDAISSSTASQGVTLRIRPYQEMTEGDIISLYWAATAHDASFIQHIRVEANDINKDIAYFVESSYTAPCKYGSALIAYTIRSGSRQMTSPYLRLEIKGDMRAPDFYHGEYYEDTVQLFPVEEDGGIPLYLPVYEDMNPGDNVAFLFLGGGATLSHNLILHRIVTNIADLRFIIPIPFQLLTNIIYVAAIVQRTNGQVVGSPVLRMSIK